MPSTAGDEHLPYGTVVYHSSTRDRCNEFALVLAAVGIPCAIHAATDGHSLTVRPENAARAVAEISAYGRENRARWRGSLASKRPPPAPISNGFPGVIAYCLLLILFAVLQQRHAFGLEWWAAGKAHAGLMHQGEWWRAITAMGLHANAPHLLANLAFGACFGLFASQTLGSGLAWFAILCAGALGNAITALLHAPTHISVGASTAVFAALGLMTGDSLMRPDIRAASPLRRWAPLIGGVVLLGFLGAGGPQTDVTAHVAGFACGGLLGAALAWFMPNYRITASLNLFWGMAAALVIFGSWAVALA